MIRHMYIPDSAVKYILLQRTEYLRFPIAPIYRRLNRYLPFETPIYNVVVGIESRLRASRIKELYEADMRKEYQAFQAFLPRTCSAVLDVGSGVAGIDVFIHRHYEGRTVDFYLLDKSRVETNVFYLYEQRGAFYNSLDVARVILTANGVPLKHVHLIEANERNEIPLDTRVDLVLSLISWGFHYPVATYVDRVHDLLSDDVVVILDVRKDTDGMDVLRRTFRQVDVIFENKKQYRAAARK